MARKVVEAVAGPRGKIETILEAYAAENNLDSAKAMLQHWLSEPPKGQGLHTYDVAELLGSTHQGVSYLCKKHGIPLAGSRSRQKMDRKAQALGHKTLKDYLKATIEKKTILEQAEELGVSDMTVKRYRRIYREESDERSSGDGGRTRGRRDSRAQDRRPAKGSRAAKNKGSRKLRDR